MKDPVCGMDVEPAKAAGISVHRGQTYYFCSKGCKATFDAAPERFAEQKGRAAHGGHSSHGHASH
jgi:Cu+-exporting ATPase